MSMGSPYAGYTTNLLAAVDGSTHEFTHDAFQNIVRAFQPEIHLALVLYIALFGMGVLTGKIPLTIPKAVRHVVFMSVVVALATHWDTFALYFNDVVTEGPSKLIAAMTGGTFEPKAMLSDVFDKGIMAAYEINKNSGIRTMGFFVIGYSVFYATMIGVGFAVFLFAVSKIALAVLLGAAPLFLLLLLFPSTQDYFNRYLMQIMTYALVPVFTSSILALFLKITQDAVNQLNAALRAHTGRGGPECLYVIFCFGVLFMLLLQVKGMAAGVAGGIRLEVRDLGNLGSRLMNWNAVKDAKTAGKVAAYAWRKGKLGFAAVRRRLKLRHQNEQYPNG